MPRPEDTFQERLYCVQWITKETLNKTRQETFFAGVSNDDLKREHKVEAIVGENLAKWQQAGLIPDMPIEPGDKTDEPIRTRGWTYWHHLFGSRHILYLSLIRKNSTTHPSQFLDLAQSLNISSRLCMINSSAGQGGAVKYDHVFHNQALNTLYNFGTRGAQSILKSGRVTAPAQDVPCGFIPNTCQASDVRDICHLWITDPPYADAIKYEEITDYFISWLRKNPPEPFKDWTWDSRRALALKG
jgi:putative DNA methylase